MDGGDGENLVRRQNKSTPVAAQYTPTSILSDEKSLLSTGLLEGLPFSYKCNGVEAQGFIKGFGYRFICSPLDYPKILSALKSLKNAAGGISNNVFLDSGVTIYTIVNRLKGTHLGYLDEVIKEVIHCPPNMEQFQKWKALFAPNGHVGIIASIADDTREMTNPEVEGSDKANWNDTNTRHFISACLTQVHDGNRPGANLNIVGYTLAGQEFNKLSGLCYSTKQIHTKWENMRKEWILWKKLLLDTGTGWSYEGGTIKATEEWWKRKKAENKEYGKFKHRGPLLPEEQEELFGKSLATGGFAVTSAEIPQEAAEKLSQPLYWSEEANNLGSEYQGSLVQLLELGNHTAPSPETTHVKTPPVSSVDKKKRKKNHQELSKSIANLNDTVSSYMAHTTSSSRGDIYSIQACIEEMDSIPEVSSNPTLNGLFLFRDPLYREMFILTKQVDKKVEFLRRGGEK